MPPSRSRKDPPKEAVVYPASKRKATPFIPQRPGKVARVAEQEGSGSGDKEGSDERTTARGRQGGGGNDVIARTVDRRKGNGGGGKKAIGLGGFQKVSALGDRRVQTIEDDSSDSVVSDSSDGGLDDDPLAALHEARKKPQKSAASTNTQNKSTKAVTAKSKPPAPPSTDFDIFSSPPDPPNPRHGSAVPPLSQSEDVPTISQPLLLRLLHEAFADKSTKIDKHAIQVLQKYMEVFMREAIARAALSKREAAECGEADEADKAWLELEDLEKIAPGMLLDF